VHFRKSHFENPYKTADNIRKQAGGFKPKGVKNTFSANTTKVTCQTGR
jgi:hypothetical protein